MSDFTLKTFHNLLSSLLNSGYRSEPFEKCLRVSDDKSIFVRLDVDKKPEMALEAAKILTELGLSGIFFFRSVPVVFNQDIITKISHLQHDIGYHYEDVSAIASKIDGSIKEEELMKYAFNSFIQNLDKFRKLSDVTMICMHGSPLSRWDSRFLWKYYDYHELGITLEPYFDINFEKSLYLTDTGRRWNGKLVNVRDKAFRTIHPIKSDPRYSLSDHSEQNGSMLFKDWKVKPLSGSLLNMNPASQEFHDKYNFKSSSDILKSVELNNLPDRIFFTFHPQRWTNRSFPWVKELIWQNFKNAGKYFLIKIRD